jgi:hypothetical protein
VRGARGVGADVLGAIRRVDAVFRNRSRGWVPGEPKFSKERRLDPHITIGLLTDAAGFPLMMEAFEGNKAETATMIPTITAFMTAHRLSDVTVVADAGMLSQANRAAIEVPRSRLHSQLIDPRSTWISSRIRPGCCTRFGRGFRPRFECPE